MNDRYIIFLDIDGTVYCHGEVVPRSAEAIRRAQQAGHKVFLNTARSLADLPDNVLETHWDGIVAGIGCTVIADGRVIRSVRIPPQELAETFDYLTTYKVPLMFEGEQILLCNRYFADQDRVILLQSGEQLVEQYADHVISKGFMPVVLYSRIRRKLSAQYQLFQHTHYAEFSAKGHNKATGMQCVLDHYGFDTAHCIAMGDSINDLDMLRHAGISVAMGDASEEVRAVCDVITCNADEGGVGEALERLLHLPSY